MTPALPLAAVALMLAAMTLVPAGDTAGKLLAELHGVNPWFTGWSRFLLGALMFLPFAGPLHHIPDLLRDWRIWLRGALLAGTIASILTALTTAPLSMAFAAFFTGPILSFVLSALLLGERVTLLRGALLFTGFVGVLIVVRPGADMAPGLGWALFAGMLYGGYLTASRWLRGRARAQELLLSQLLVGAFVLAPPGLMHLPQVAPGVALLVVLSALASLLGNLCLVLAYRRADAARLAPLVYFQLVAATGWGIVVFSDWPDGQTMIGLAVLVLSGLASFLPRVSR